jgi:hypothetical protein
VLFVCSAGRGLAGSCVVATGACTSPPPFAQLRANPAAAIVTAPHAIPLRLRIMRAL